MNTDQILQDIRLAVISLLTLLLMLTAGCQSRYKCVSTGKVSRVKSVLEAEKDIEKRKECTRRLLNSASGRGHIEVVKFLLEDEIAVSELLEEWTTDALYGAARRGYLEIVKILLANGADVNKCFLMPPSWIPPKRTPLYSATFNGHKETVKLLLDSGADVNMKCENGESALLRALRDRQMEIAEILLSYGTDINDKNNGRGTALHMAVALDRPEMVRYILSKGADVNAEIGLGVRPLHIAAWCDKVEIARILLAHGADPTLRCDGRTALEIARSGEFRKLLQQHSTTQRP